MNIEYALICWAGWVADGCRTEDTVTNGNFKARLNSPEKTMEQAVDEAVKRLPPDLKSLIKLYYLERQTRISCMEKLGLDRDAFRLQINFAEQLIASTVFAN